MYSGDSKIEKKVTFILAAAGQGKRMNMSLAKQFLEYKGEPLFYSSLKIAFENFEEELKSTDILIVATGASHPIIHQKHFPNETFIVTPRQMLDIILNEDMD